MSGARQSRPGEPRPAEARTAETRYAEALAAAVRPVEARSGEARPGEARPGEARAGETRSGTRHGPTLSRITADPEAVEKGLVTLVLTLVELLRQLMERQALRRVDQGDLTEDQIERVGSTLMALEERMTELREHFGLRPEDLNIDLGPLGPLLPED